MCRKYILRCGTCRSALQSEVNIIVNCQNGQHGDFDSGIELSSVLYQQHPFNPCSEIEETKELIYGPACPFCVRLRRDGPDPREVKFGANMIKNLITSDSSLLHITSSGFDSGSALTQAKFRVEGERRKEFNKIKSACDAWGRTDERQYYPDISRSEIFQLEKLINSIKLFNLVADADDKYGHYPDGNPDGKPLPPLLREFPLTALAEKNCNICGEEMGKLSPENTLEKPVRTPCQHIFGHLCILTWLNETNDPTCPMCRSRFFTHSHQFPEGYYDGRGDASEDEEDDGDEIEIPDNWLDMLMDAAINDD